MSNLYITINRIRIFILALIVLANWVIFPGSYSNSSTTSAFADVTATPKLADKATRTRASQSYGNLPISFEANQGQFDSRVKFVSRGNGCTMFLTANEAVFQLRVGAETNKRDSHLIETENLNPAIPDSQLAILKMKLVGASAAPVAQGVNELPGKVNYFVGNDSKKWRTGVATYAKALFKQVYPGVDIVYYGNQRELEYDLKVAPGANPRAVRLAFEGARHVRIDKRGDLVLSTAAGEIRQRKPVAYQETNGTRKEISARFVMKGAQQVGFEVARYDTSKPLVIDPALSYSTYLGGSEEDSGNGIAVDTSGNAYIIGFTVSSDFPTTASFQPTAGGFGDVFITKLNTTGTALIYSTYLSGSGSDFGFGIAVDAAGNAYATGQTISSDFPLMNPIQSTLSSAGDVFITKLNSTGSAIIYSTLLGGNRIDIGQSIAVDAGGSAYVTGFTASNTFPTVNALQPVFGGMQDGFVAKLNPMGTAFVYSSYLGGVGRDSGNGVATDSSGNAYVAGSTSSPDFLTANALQPAFKGKTAFKSVNGAANWAHINNGLPVHGGINSLAVDPINTSTLYAGTVGSGIFKSTNGGNTWNPINNGIGSLTTINAVAIDPLNPATLFAATLAGSIFKTTDGGTNWNLVTSFNTEAIAFDPVNPANVYAGLRNSIARSTDGGQTWGSVVILAGLTVGNIHSIAIDPSVPSTIYVGGDIAVFKSFDSGNTWETSGSGVTSQPVNTLAIDPTNTQTLYAGSFVAVYKSTNGGANWTRTQISRSTIHAIVIDPVTTSTLYAATLGEGIFKSTNGGNTWVNMNNGMGNLFANVLAIDVGNPSTIYSGNLAVRDGFVLKLNQNGSALVYSTFIGGDNSDSCTGIAVDGSGNAYMVGSTSSTNFPTANALQTYSGFGDAFITKLNSAGTGLIYSTYLGGSDGEAGSGIAIDSGGNAYVVGTTGSTDFPTVAALQPTLGGVSGDAFVTKLNATGTAFDYSTYLGGSIPPDNVQGPDIGNAIAVDSSGNAYVAGETFSTTFPTTPGAFQVTLNGEQADAFVSKISIFDICLQDDVNGNLLEFNSTTGEYRFSNCRKKFTLTGRGTVSTKLCKVELKANAPGHSITALANTCVHNGSATVQVSAQRQTYTVNDKNTANNSCSCQ
ncbi:MAG TPA: SBBP repeat-containing protein [Blastocatellia bacterium]|nr:SBBP repeat-containing protein [Blastocatellia bacterium]